MTERDYAVIAASIASAAIGEQPVAVMRFTTGAMQRAHLLRLFDQTVRQAS